MFYKYVYQYSSLTFISDRALWGNSWQIMEKSVPTMLIARKNMSVSEGKQQTIMAWKNNMTKASEHNVRCKDVIIQVSISIIHISSTFAGPGFRIGPFPEAWVSRSGATLKDGVSTLSWVWPFGSQHFNCQAKTQVERIWLSQQLVPASPISQKCSNVYIQRKKITSRLSTIIRRSW